jgi:copper chaperone CopZ
MAKIYTVFFLILMIVASPLRSGIYELRLTIDDMTCPYCGRSVVDQLKKIAGVESAQVWALDGFGLVNWKENVPFQSALLFRKFAETRFLLKTIEIDVEGVVEKKKGALILVSKPDNSVFYIDNLQDYTVAKLKEGQTVRLKGFVKNQQGFNFLVATEVLPEVKPS